MKTEVNEMKKTYCIKKTDEYILEGDFYCTDEVHRPVILYIHGGGLFFGSKEEISPEIVQFYLKAGYHLFSINYRLAPEAKISEIKEDIILAFEWLKNNTDPTLTYNHEKIILMGSSAGAYLSLLSACSTIKPFAIISFYGYGRIDSSWATTPNHYYNTKNQVPYSLVEHLLSTIPLTSCPAEARYALYLYGRQSGKWIELITSSPEERKMNSPYYYLDAHFPPTILLHGTNDQDVPYSESEAIYTKLKDLKVPTQLVTIPNGKHLFDTNFNSPVVQRAYKEVISFLNLIEG